MNDENTRVDSVPDGPEPADVPAEQPEAPSPEVETSPVPEAEPAAPEEEPSTPEQDARDRRIWWALVAAGIIGMLVFMWFGRPILMGRLEAARKLDKATAILASTNPAMASVDSAVNAEVLTQEAATSADVTTTVVTTRQQLKDAVRMIDEGYPKLTEDEQRRANLVKLAAEQRVAMLDAAPVILEANAAAAASKPLAEDAWTRTLEADKLAHGAVAEYNKLTKASGANASAMNAKAEVEFASARDLFSRASSGFPQAKLDVYVVYVDQRLRALALSRQSDAALAAGSNAQANALIASYNAEDAKAVALAKQLPASPTKVIIDAYEAATKAARAAYDAARIKADEADKALKQL